MKTPLRLQMTEYDCGTVSLLNAFSCLFEREEIPALLVKKIFQYTLDASDELGNVGQGGTSCEAVGRLSAWITRYANSHNFDVICQHLRGEAVTLSAMLECLEADGVVFVRCWQRCQHYVIITKIKDDQAYIFDSYYLPKDYYDNDPQVKIVLNQPFSYNRVVSLERMFGESEEDFSLGVIPERECVLINRHNRVSKDSD